jgi:hypothetical protein
MHRVGESCAIMGKLNCHIFVLHALMAKELGFGEAQKPINLDVFQAFQQMIEWNCDQVLSFLWKREPNMSWLGRALGIWHKHPEKCQMMGVHLQNSLGGEFALWYAQPTKGLPKVHLIS